LYLLAGKGEKGKDSSGERSIFSFDQREGGILQGNRQKRKRRNICLPGEKAALLNWARSGKGKLQLRKEGMERR